MSGRFVVLEGLDGAGTTTQLALLADRLEARHDRVVRTHEPTDLPIGVVIRQLLRRQSEVHPRALPWLFAADRQDHLLRRIEPALVGGAWVLSDRYYPSSLAYQSLGMPLEQVAALNASFRVPNLFVVLDIPVPIALARIEARGGQREIFEERERLLRISAAYERVYALLSARGEPLVRIDGTQSIEAVAHEVWAAVAAL